MASSIELVTGVAGLCGFLLLWTGLVRCLGQYSATKHRKLGLMLTAFGILLTGLSVVAGICATEKGYMLLDYDSLLAFKIINMPDMIIRFPTWEFGRALILSIAYRKYRHALPAMAGSLLVLALIASWTVLPFVFIDTSEVSYYLEDNYIVCSLFMFTENLAINLPILVLGWLLVCGKILNHYSGKNATSTLGH